MANAKAQPAETSPEGRIEWLDDIAGGYHRVSLAYRLDRYGNVPRKLA
jgi:hypothetical protein